MKVFQREIILSGRGKGVHLIEEEICNKIHYEMKNIRHGVAHIFLKHTSAALFLNEGFDPAVRHDLESFTDNFVQGSGKLHIIEGVDDMPSHVLNAFFGSSLTIPITNGKFNLGEWQKIFMIEYRYNNPNRKIVITMTGQ